MNKTQWETHKRKLIRNSIVGVVAIIAGTAISGFSVPTPSMQVSIGTVIAVLGGAMMGTAMLSRDQEAEYTHRTGKKW